MKTGYGNDDLRPTFAKRLLLAGICIFLPLPLAPVFSTAAPQSEKDLAQQILDVMVQIPGNKPGYRPLHAKGIVCGGTFSATKDAAQLSRAEHFGGATTPVTVRFSDSPPES